MQVFQLYFGKSVAGRADVSDKEWRAFLDDTLTVNLPNGYTVHEGYGAWMNPVTHRTIREATIIVTTAMPDTAESQAAVNRVRAEYQVRFRQQLVGMTVTPSCGTF